MVPVLSRTTTDSSWARSSASLFLNRMPCSAPLPVPTMIAVGVARPSAQGQAMTNTATIKIMLSVKPTRPTRSQPKKVSSAVPMTTGTNTADTRSARRWIGALEPWASSTSRMIWASAV